ncbi:MAG: helix-turn-helix domain-containing protein [Muribaculaceae bacterium]|nr:helix-turn-helix domain-containing protein [Muribaculaceae bacterium]
MRQLNPEKLAKLPTFGQQLDEEYGKPGSPDREKFHDEALSWYYGQLLRNRRRELKMTQKQVAEKLGREQSYIARVERGKADIQLSSFFRIAAVLGIQFIPTFASVMK